MNIKHITILGTRGIPAHHGGFETFAENLALFLVDRNWRVTVYCQVNGVGQVTTNIWRGVERVNIPISWEGALGTVLFDWKSVWHAVKTSDLTLTLGYNTAIFCVFYRLKGVCNLINMDGIEWRRNKWSLLEKIWLYLNERAGCWLGNHLIADHPSIASHLATRVDPGKITTIPYGADPVESADIALISTMGLSQNEYVLVIARAEPENSILDIVKAFSVKPRGMKMVVLGNYKPRKNAYHRTILDSASSEVVFAGAIYDRNMVNALRYFCRLYIHGHTVGGTNPSLVEALGAGSAVLAHANLFNRWVAGSGAHYFKTSDECAYQLDILLNNEHELATMSEASRKRFYENFTWDKVLSAYEILLGKWIRSS